MSGARTIDQLREAVRTIQALRGRVAALQAERTPAIAIIGMACRFAGAEGSDQLWKVLAGGCDSVGPVPADRWAHERWFSPDPESPGKIVFREAGFLADVDGFDNELFGIAAREAAGMDPQHRLVLEVAWEALEDAFLPPDRLAGVAAGVYLGLNGGDHLLATLGSPARVGTHALAGSVASIAAGRIAYLLGLTGPAMVVDTACSSSLVAVHLAVQALRSGECSLALAGGVHLMLAPNVSVALSRARMMAPDGRCKAFDAAADGFGQGEGCGLVVLKRLSDAEAAGDRVLAVISGTAVNQDGRSAGITAPRQGAQEAVIRTALANAGLTPEAVDAIEAHGTGTALGDPIEMHALAAVFAGHRRPLPVGSVKTNLGHAAAAAGIAGLLKAVLMLRHQAVPASLHFRRLNPHIGCAGVPLEVPTELRPQPLGCVGVSSFGFSGTNAHVVLQRAEASAASSPGPAAAPRLLISARTREALRDLIARYRALLDAGTVSFADACFSAAIGRARLPWRVCVADPAELANAEPSNAPLPELPPQGGRKIDLPLYPFQHRRFPRVTAGTPADAPAFPGRLIDTPSADRLLECVLDLAHQPWLADHRVQGRIVVPGAVMIALLLAAAPPGTNSLADVRFTEPLILDEIPVRLVAVAFADGSLSVSSRNGEGWTRHATARCAAEPVAEVTTSASPPPSGWMSRADWVAHLAALGIEIGPAFQGIARIAAGPITIAELDASAAPEPAGFHFHPALLDAALQVAGGTLPAEPVLPVRLERLSFHHALRGSLHVVARRPDDAVDLTVFADQGISVSVQGLEVRRLSDSLPPTVAALVWTPLAASGGTSGPAEVFNIAPRASNLADALALIRRRLDRPAPIAFITRGATPPVSDPAAAIFAGIASALADERPELRCRCIDVAADVPASVLEDELAQTDGEPVVALRPEGRFVPRLVPAAASGNVPRLSGTVLVTGGLGGIGRHTAAWCVQRGAEAVLLVGRSGGDAPPGLHAHVLAADIAAPDSLPAIRAALSRLPPLGAIIHTAGVLRDGLVESRTPADFEAVIAPKLGGAWTLHRLTETHPAEHFVLFGSVASIIGAAGQSTYAAANAALDAFAEWRSAQGLPGVSIAWGRWWDTGMAARLSSLQRTRIMARGLAGMVPARALAALDQAILAGTPRVMVASLDFPRLATVAPPAFSRLVPQAVPDSGPLALQVAASVRQVLGQAAEPGCPLIACGLDSLMATDLRNRLNRRFGVSLALSDLLGGTDIDGVVAAVECAIAASREMEVVTL